MPRATTRASPKTTDPMTNWRQIEAAICGGYATLDTFRGLEPEAIRSIKSELPFQVRSVLAPSIRTVHKADKAGEILDFRASVEVVDRMGDIIMLRPNKSARPPAGDDDRPQPLRRPEGRGFLVQNMHDAGAPLLWNHNASLGHALPPIGQVTKSMFRTVDVPKRFLTGADRNTKRNALIQRVEFVTDDAIPFSRAAFILAQRGVLRAVSVGFVPVVVDIVDDEEAHAIGLGKFGVVFRESDQLELSLTPSPANPMALVDDSGAKAADRAIERRIHKELTDAAERGLIESSLVRDFERAYPLSGSDADRRLAEKLRSVVPVIADVTGEYATTIAARASDLLTVEPAADGASRAPAPQGRAPATITGGGGGGNRPSSRPIGGDEGPPGDDGWVIDTAWGGLGQPSVLRGDGTPIRGAEVTLETSQEGRLVRARLKVPTDEIRSNTTIELLGPCDPDIARAVRMAARDAQRIPDGVTVSQDDALTSLGDVLGVERGTATEAAFVERIAQEARSLAIRHARHITDLESIVEELPDEARERCLRAQEARGNGRRLSAGELTKRVRIELRRWAYSLADEVPASLEGMPASGIEDLWRAFDRLSECANIMGRALDQHRRIPGAAAQRTEVQTLDRGDSAGSDVGQLRRSIAELASRLQAIESKRAQPPADSPRESRRTADRPSAVDRVRGLTQRVDDALR